MDTNSSFCIAAAAAYALIVRRHASVIESTAETKRALAEVDARTGNVYFDG